jgi:sporulation protein YlmC with PRC-barrel domain
MVLAGTLVGRQVTSTDGQVLGSLATIRFNAAIGEIRELSVYTGGDDVFGVEPGPNGAVRLPASLIAPSEDGLVLRPP